MRSIITDYASYEADIRAIRDQVFVLEQSVPREDEFDGRDCECLHVVVFDRDLPVGTGRLDLGKHGKVGRMAVLRTHRRAGVGSTIMQELEKYATGARAKRIWCHAQIQAVEFYAKLGFTVCSDEFEEAGIPHVVMEKSLSV